MRLIKQSHQILEQSPGIEGIFKQIELAGRTCYKSEDKITKDSAKKFVDMLIARGHTAMLEHGTVYLTIPVKYVPIHYGLEYKWNTTIKYEDNHYSKINYIKFEEYKAGIKVVSDEILSESPTMEVAFVTTNYRVLLENGWLDDLKYLCEPTKYHEKRVTVKFITSIGIGRELLRHRILPEDWEDLGKDEPNFSYANESTRYCNYSKDKFGGEVTFIIPSNLDIPEDTYHVERFRSKNNPEVTCMVEASENNGAYNIESPIGKFLHVLDYSSDKYLELISEGWLPQHARDILPLATKSELVMTGFISDWVKVFLQRVDGTTGKPHPDMKALMEPVKQEFIERGFI